MNDVYLDPEECPAVTQAMGMVGMLEGYPLFKIVQEQMEFVCYEEE